MHLSTNTDNVGIGTVDASNGKLVVTGGNVGIGTTTPQGGFVVTNGNVGIGTWAPAFPLHMQFLDSTTGVSNASSLMIKNSDTTNNNGALINFRLKGSDDAGDYAYAWIFAQATNHTAATRAGLLSFYTSNSGNPTEKMRIQADGNVGIGSTAPGQVLDVTGGVRTKGASGGCIMLRDTDNNGWTKCTALAGVLTCTVSTTGLCP